MSKLNPHMTEAKKSFSTSNSSVYEIKYSSVYRKKRSIGGDNMSLP